MIRINITQRIADQAMYAAAFDSAKRFEKELGDNYELTIRIAKAACESCMEQVQALFNHELRMIEVEWERKAGMFELQPPTLKV